LLALCLAKPALMSSMSMSLDEIIKTTQEKGTSKGSKGGRGGGGRGATKTIGKIGRGGRGRGVAAATLQSMARGSGASTLIKPGQGRAPRAVAAAAPKTLTTGTKLRVGNLDLNVTQDDLSELFQEIGKCKTVELQTKDNGRSKGFAFVVYTKKADALKAIEQYNGVPLDGRPLQISLATGSPSAGATAVASSIAVAVAGAKQRTVVVKAKGSSDGYESFKPQSVKPRGSARGGKGGKGGRGKGGRGGRGQGRGPTPKAEDLDADLDAYRSAA